MFLYGVVNLLKFKQMKKDIEKLLQFLQVFTESFKTTDTFLLSEKEDEEMNNEIRAIAKKHGLKF